MLIGTDSAVEQINLTPELTLSRPQSVMGNYVLYQVKYYHKRPVWYALAVPTIHRVRDEYLLRIKETINAK